MFKSKKLILVLAIIGCLMVSRTIAWSPLYAITEKLDELIHLLKNDVIPRLDEYRKPTLTVAKTGQTVSYASRDDGDLQKGMVWPKPRFVDHGDGTVTDNLTGLMWTRDACQIPGQPSWREAVTACNNLVFAGYDDWRLPNIRELQSLMDYGKYSPALPEGNPFIGICGTYYWTSTTTANVEYYAWCVSMETGALWRAGDKEYIWGYNVWPVRGGK
jgi:hypothetical protein